MINEVFNISDFGRFLRCFRCILIQNNNWRWYWLCFNINDFLSLQAFSSSSVLIFNNYRHFDTQCQWAWWHAFSSSWQFNKGAISSVPTMTSSSKDICPFRERLKCDRLNDGWVITVASWCLSSKCLLAVNFCVEFNFCVWFELGS